MATIKSFTSLEQSRKLAEILPLESADMCYVWNFEYERYIPELFSFITDQDNEGVEHIDFPCWSLASLLEQLKSEIRLENKQILHLHLNKYDDTDYEIRYTNSWTGEVLITEADNLVDACVAMVEKLHELKML